MSKIYVRNKDGGLDELPAVKGDPGQKGDPGDKGDKGDKGDTPVKGTDYFTDADKTELVNSVLNALPTWQGGEY